MSSTFHTGGVAISTTTTTSLPPSATATPGEWQEEETSIWVLQVVSFWVLMPVVMAVGVVINALGLYLLHRPRLRDLPATGYLKLLLSQDIAALLFSVSQCVTLNRCYLHSYTVALYFAHPFLTVYCALQIFCHYVIMWMCCDRFLALWCFTLFQKTQQKRVMTLRITFTGLLCVAINLRHLLDVKVVCVGDSGVVEATNHTEDCEKDSWIILDSLHQAEEGEPWHDVGFAVRGVLGMIVPLVLVLVFSSGIVVGMVRHRLQNIAATANTRHQAYSTIYITLALSLSFVTSVISTTIYLSLYATNVKKCHGSFRQEVLRVAFHFFMRLDHIIHILFLAINQTFRAELRKLLQDTRNYLSNVLTGLAQSTCPSYQPRSATHSVEIVSDDCISIEEGPQVPHLMVSAAQEQPDEGMSGQSPGDGAAILFHPIHASNSVAMGSEINVLK